MVKTPSRNTDGWQGSAALAVLRCTVGYMLRCRVLGHRFRFTSERETMSWQCQRGCEAGGAKRYASAEDARRYAEAFDKEDRDDLGRRAPLVGLLPLRLIRALRQRRKSDR
ncbi:hypothetical protein LDL08_07695 [Nonomuraea glycinis]|uniref:Uncharacterized protein n=1 Tax=Nonomuraea glycinis TaxID=2047744 RepID=A0A918AIH3_9ACTN|nr:hypothetical protein [Nonomuraea glycinis]MCA2176059.1 hypothetical protein [Nonomuraea glycinis]GGP18020.1 hypothetical protein GCM10012278_88700 [Nonomuraea glycinis]